MGHTWHMHFHNCQATLLYRNDSKLVKLVIIKLVIISRLRAMRRVDMIPELKKIGIVTSATAAVGLIFGVLVGALTGDFLLWMGVLAACGFGLGLVLSYGFLPES